jgi:hypothetical protein
VSNVLAIHSVGQSLMTFLTNAYPATLKAIHTCTFKQISSGELAKPGQNNETSVTLFLYRITMNEHLRNTPHRIDLGGEQFPLSIDLHYLITVWADTPLVEQAILAWVMQQLNQRPLLDLSALSPEANWSGADYVQIIPAELSNEDMMRIWDALDPPYRLSVSYVGRVVRIEAERTPDVRRVTATRFGASTTVEVGLV